MGSSCCFARRNCVFGRNLGWASSPGRLVRRRVGVSLPKVGSASGFGGACALAPARRGGGPAGFGLLFAFKGVLGSGAAFPVLGNCPRHLPEAVGQSLPPWLALSGRRALGCSAPQASPLASPRQAFSFDPLEPPASFPTAGISPSPPHLLVTSKGVPPTSESSPPLYPSPLSRLASTTLRVATASPPPLGSLPPPFSPSPLHSSSHCLPPPPPLSPSGLLPHRCHVVV